MYFLFFRLCDLQNSRAGKSPDHFEMASKDSSRLDKEGKKYEVLLCRLRSLEFLLDLVLLYVLSELTSLSLELQKRDMTLPKAENNLKRSIRVH